MRWNKARANVNVELKLMIVYSILGLLCNLASSKACQYCTIERKHGFSSVDPFVTTEESQMDQLVNWSLYDSSMFGLQE